MHLQLDDFGAFDVFKVARLTQQQPLRAVTMALIQRYDLVAKLSLPVGKLTSFLQVLPPISNSQASCLASWTLWLCVLCAAGHARKSASMFHV